jgi:hypothetical protein
MNQSWCVVHLSVIRGDHNGASVAHVRLVKYLPPRHVLSHMHADIERALSVMTAVGEGTPSGHAATTTPWNGISQE